MTRRLVQLGVMAVMVPSDVHWVACCLSDHRRGVIFAVVVICQQKQQWQLQQQEWRPWGKRCVENNYVIDTISAHKGTRLCVCLKGPQAVCVVIILET